MTKAEIAQMKKDLITKQLSKSRTANEVIQNIFNNDMKKGSRFVATKRGWKFYVHLNKYFSNMEKAGVIRQTGLKNGEKLWLKK